MTHTFKEGDKVKVLRMPSDCIGDFPPDRVGTIVTISTVGNRGYCVDNNRWNCNFIETDLEGSKDIITNWQERLSR